MGVARRGVDFVPPAETNQAAAGDVFEVVEVSGEEEDGDDEDEDEGGGEDEAAEEVDEEGGFSIDTMFSVTSLRCIGRMCMYVCAYRRGRRGR